MSAPEAKQNEVASVDVEDEFEEFKVDEWDQKAEDPANQQLWEADWDDDDVNDDFSQRLKDELARQPQQQK